MIINLRGGAVGVRRRTLVTRLNLPVQVDRGPARTACPPQPSSNAGLKPTTSRTATPAAPNNAKSHDPRPIPRKAAQRTSRFSVPMSLKGVAMHYQMFVRRERSLLVVLEAMSIAVFGLAVTGHELYRNQCRNKGQDGRGRSAPQGQERRRGARARVGRRF